MNTGKTTINPYLSFNGNCREAMTFYKTALDGELEIMTFADSPMEVPEDHKNKVMHASVKFADAILMASDGMPGNEVTFGDAYNISIGAKSAEEGERYFKNLSEGGSVTMPYSEQFWGDTFGMLTDKFGIRWMVNAAKGDKQFI
ncbi:MAG: VOC family protein [Calditrichaeota bacterium]|nr:MAG: VOC family protein [Calditrichota bacterium]MBL1206384.1 VOC family protein [Calditrichota bacterium]NOG46210.1 VOC family protein [Calditrichota bacterium]